MSFKQKSFICLVILLSLYFFNFPAQAYNPQFADEAKTIRLSWKSTTIPIAISTSMLKQNLSIRPDSDVSGAIRRSLETWENIADIKFVNVSTEKQSVSPSGKSGDGVSLITIAQTAENLLLFGSDSEEISARTRVFYNGKGFITEADIVLNPYQQFSTDGSIGTFDLEATLTHELGHVLGLDHSTILGSTMQANQGKNGVYNLPAYVSRSLAEDDIAGIRAIYGANIEEENCCGSIGGKLSLVTGKAAAGFQIWLESVGDGRVYAGIITNVNGEYEIAGLPAGRYNVLTKSDSDLNLEANYSAQDLGQIEIEQGRRTVLSERLADIKSRFEIQYVGFNGQLSELPVPVNAGKSYLIYLGGKNLDAADLIVGFNSPNIKVTPGSITKHDYGKDISVISFEIKLSPFTVIGEYSFFVKRKDILSDISVGSLTVESFVNPWNSYLIREEEY